MIITGTNVRYVKKSSLRLSSIFALLTLILIGFLGVVSTAQALGGCDAAVPASINAASVARNLPVGGRQYFKVTAPSDGLLSAHFLGDFYGQVRILDKDCIPVSKFYGDYSQYSWSGENITQGIYFIEISPYNNYVDPRYAGLYKVQIDGDFASDDRGVSCASATVAHSFVEQGGLTMHGDQDFFQIKVGNSSHRLIASIESGLPQSGRILLYDKNCVLVSQNNSSSIDTTLAAGIYYVNVHGYSIGDKGKYNIRLSGDIVLPTGSCNGKLATLSGTNSNDLIAGTLGNDVIQAFGGNDVITGLAGDDTICGGDGDDMLQGGDGADTLVGEAGDDILDGGALNDSLNGGLGTDMCNGGLQTDTQTGCEVKNLIP